MAEVGALPKEEEWLSSKSNPLNWSRGRKWSITLAACYMSSLISIAASAYSIGEDEMVVDLHTSHLLVVSGISFFTIAVGTFPLILAPVGEAKGRRYVYLISYAIFFLFSLPVALARNVETVLVSRFIMGAAGSVGSTMVGGTLADLWAVEERVLPMALFSLSALFGTPIGPMVFSWTGNHANWRWIHWTMLIAGAPSALLVLTVFNRETLASTIRQRLHFEEKPDYSRLSFVQRVQESLQISAVRPLIFLFTEPIATAICLYIGFAWGTLYLFLQSIPLVFQPYGFVNESGTQGLAFTGLAVGSLLGFLVFLIWQQYTAPIPTAPEKRLNQACVGGIAFTAGFFWYAWTAKPGSIHWIVPQMGTALLMAGLYLFYVSVFTYLSECYGEYTSSAIAAQSFLRNVLATAFPLFAAQMYQTLTYPWASSLLGFLAGLLAVVPFALKRYGPTLRARSPYARMIIARTYDE
ncbi:hypothetical protein CBS101457_002901 [Exobasidium rhododendri]|nr:hypothetical protein CBS101457_002901 [Exobasidium rhododendri]